MILAYNLQLTYSRFDLCAMLIFLMGYVHEFLRDVITGIVQLYFLQHDHNLQLATYSLSLICCAGLSLWMRSHHPSGWSEGGFKMVAGCDAFLPCGFLLIPRKHSGILVLSWRKCGYLPMQFSLSLPWLLMLRTYLLSLACWGLCQTPVQCVLQTFSKGRLWSSLNGFLEAPFTIGLPLV